MKTDVNVYQLSNFHIIIDIQETKFTKGISKNVF